MSIEQLWNEYELYFYHEFINDINFPESKKEKLQEDLGCFFITKDFTIYQEKSSPIDKITDVDYHRNCGTFICILYNLPITKVKDFIKFHYDKYSSDKLKFLEFLYHELKNSKLTQGTKELPPPPQKVVTMEWCQEKINYLKSKIKQSDSTQQTKTISKHKSLSKLIALRERVISTQKIHNSVPQATFDSMKNQFLKEVENLKSEFTDLEDFEVSNYNHFKTSFNAYFRGATEALVADINYFINFLENVETHNAVIHLSDNGIYFSGQYFDALLKFNEIISTATSEIILIDNYLDEKILHFLGSKNTNVKCRVLTLKKSMNPNLTAFVEAFNKQHQNLDVKYTSVFHDRFLILDKKNFYHFGASIKDVGHKGFMFSKIEEEFIKQSLLEKVEAEWTK